GPGPQALRRQHAGAREAGGGRGRARGAAAMTLGRNTPPRDAVAATHLWVPVDATGDDFYALGGRFGTQVGVLHKRHEQSEQPYAAAEGTGFFDPRALRWHDLQRETERGVSDRRMAIQVVNDFDAPY